MTRPAPIDMSFLVQLYKSLLLNTTTTDLLLNDYAPRLFHCILYMLNETKKKRAVYLIVTLNKKACLLGEGIHCSVLFKYTTKRHFNELMACLRERVYNLWFRE